MNKISVFEHPEFAPPTLPPHSAMPIRGMPLQDTVNQ